MKLWHAWARKMYVTGKSLREIAHVINQTEDATRWALDLNGEQAATKARGVKRRSVLRARPPQPELITKTDPTKKQNVSAKTIIDKRDRMKRLWADPKFREKQAAAASYALKKTWENPEFREKKRVAARANLEAQRNTPDFRAKWLAARRLRAARERAFREVIHSAVQ